MRSEGIPAKAGLLFFGVGKGELGDYLLSWLMFPSSMPLRFFRVSALSSACCFSFSMSGFSDGGSFNSSASIKALKRFSS